MQNLHKPLHERLAELVVAAGLNQKELAQRAAMDRRRVSAILNGRRRPGLSELDRLAAALGVRTALLGSHPALLQWHSDDRFDVRHWYLPGAERNVERRFAAAKQIYGRMVTQLWDRAQTETHAAAYLALASSDSSPEWTVGLHALAAGYKPIRKAPLQIGFRRHPVVDHASGLSVGDCPVPALVGESGGLPVLLMPQVPLRIGNNSPTLDFLCVAKRRRRRHYINLEIDGSGHRSSYDQRRAELIAMPTVRFTETEVGRLDFMELFTGRLLTLIDLE
ncbi:MAG: helix-turn-helix transcriptional regulator [Candidatus Eremiobacterota bacterium]